MKFIKYRNRKYGTKIQLYLFDRNPSKQQEFCNCNLSQKGFKIKIDHV